MSKTAVRYAIALGSVATAFLVRWMMNPSLGNELPFSSFIFAVCLTAWLTGAGPTYLAAGLSLVIGTFFFVSRRHSLWIENADDVIRVILFGVASVILARIGDAVRAARARSSEAESVAQRQEETLRATLAGLRDAVVKTDAAGLVVYLNAVAEVWTGVSTADATGRPFRTLFSDLDLDLFARQPCEVECYSAHTSRWLRATISPASDDGRVVVLRDISDRKSSDRLQSGQQAVLERIAVGAPLHEVLASVCRLIEEQEPGLLCCIVLTDEHRRHTVSGIGPSLPASYLTALENIRIIEPYVGTCCAAIDTGAEVCVNDVAADSRWSAEWRDLNLAHELRACRSVPVHGKGDEILASVAIFRRTPGDPGPRNRGLLDIAVRLVGIAVEKSRAETRLRTSSEWTRLLWEAAAVLLTTDDLNAMMQDLFTKIAPRLQLDCYLNYMVHDGHEEVRLASYAGIAPEVVPQVEHLAFGEGIAGAVAVLGAPIIATQIQDSDDPRFVRVKSFGIRAYVCHPLKAGDRLLGTLSFASASRDEFASDELDFLATISRYVTAAYDRLSLISRLQDADRRKDEFLATLAHELRNPLAPLRNGLEILRLSSPADGEVAEVSDMMDRQLSQMVRLIEDLLDISRISRGKISLKKERIEIQTAIEQAVETVQPLADLWQNEIDLELTHEPIYVLADLTRLSQIFANLLNNACKYTERGGKVALSLARDANDAVVTVRDNGCGIPENMLPRVFEMFTQVDRSLEKSQGGLGIGLSLVKGLVELHGGTVQARSDGPGKGSEFSVRLPIALSLVKADEPARTLTPAAGSRRILVVDDNEDAARSLAMMLRKLGNETATAFDGLEGLNIAPEFRPDVIFLDIGMPRLNGLDTARRIREEPWGHNVLLIALTGWGQEEDLRRSREAGFDAHLVKPVSLEALRDALNITHSNTA